MNQKSRPSWWTNKGILGVNMVWKSTKTNIPHNPRHEKYKLIRQMCLDFNTYEWIFVRGWLDIESRVWRSWKVNKCYNTERGRALQFFPFFSLKFLLWISNCLVPAFVTYQKTIGAKLGDIAFTSECKAKVIWSYNFYGWRNYSWRRNT